MVTRFSREYSFSKLKKIKNELKSVMEQKWLDNLTVMSTECEFLNELDIFKYAKSRKYRF